MNIPDKAVEAAAKEKYGHPWDRAPQWAKDEAREVARDMLEAAAPFIAAHAWDEAADYYGVGQADVREGKRDNPYRDDKTITWHAQPGEHLEPGNIFGMAHDDEVEW